ncbi:MAG TPA: S8 family serine peptidase, partial [Caldilineae bacterium]|nr:S8 family serine peptidase [Caldilineae bacterium]
DPLTDGDPAKKPDVMNNSWGCPESEGCTSDVLDVIEPSMNAAIDAGILVVVSAGNAGSACHTVQDPPAIYPRSFAVGATQFNDSLASFSSRGDVTYGGETFMKPNISAPGSYITSSTPNDNYGSMSGTSMAGPHVAGVAALLLSAEPSLKGQPEMAQAILERTADAMVDNTCGGDADGHPNNSYGWGIANAQSAIESLSQQATLDGVISDGLTSAAVEGATVTLYALSDTSTPLDSTTTAADGGYSFSLSWGSYRIEVSKTGYETTTVEPIYVVGGQTTTADAVLNPKPAAVSTDLSIEASNGEAILHWRHVDDTVVRYEIWRSPNPYPDRLNADTSKVGEVTPGALNEMLSFTDPNSTLNDPATESAYVVYAINSLGIYSDVDHGLGEREFSLVVP